MDNLCDNKKSHMNLNAITNNEISYDKIKSIADWLLNQVEFRPKIAILCGLSCISDRLEKRKIISYESIPEFPQIAQGNANGLIFGYFNQTQVVCMQGLFHAYEGHSNAYCTLPIKVLKLIGVETVILTSPVRAINQSYEVGDIMIVKDHFAPLLWTLQNPLVGHNDDRFGTRFPGTNKIYTKSLRNQFWNIVKERGMEGKVHEGVYSSFGGPCYETVSDLRGMLVLGIDTVGMSIAPEALVASYCGLKVFALALVTQKAVIEYDSEVSQSFEELVETQNDNDDKKTLEDLIFQFVSNLEM